MNTIFVCVCKGKLDLAYTKDMLFEYKHDG